MKNSLKGFVEGTYNVTTGDKMKSGDHRRSKFRCKFFQSDMCLYSSSKCMGSAHCDNYNDGVEVYVREESFDYKLLPSVTFYCSYLHLYTFLLLFRKKDRHHQVSVLFFASVLGFEPSPPSVRRLDLRRSRHLTERSQAMKNIPLEIISLPLRDRWTTFLAKLP